MRWCTSVTNEEIIYDIEISNKKHHFITKSKESLKAFIVYIYKAQCKVLKCAYETNVKRSQLFPLSPWQLSKRTFFSENRKH